MIQQDYGAYDAHGRRKYLTRQEGMDFLREAKSLPTRKRLLCETLYYVGCRPSELIALKASDIDSREKVLLVKCLKKRGKLVIRRIHISQTLTEALQGLETAQADGRLWPITRTTVWRIVTGVMSKAGIRGKHASPKGLRHGFGVRGTMEQIPIHVIQRWMGHSDSRTTAIYLDVQNEEERKLAERMWP